MTRANPIKTSFNAGEISPRLDGRIDFAKYGNGCKSIENFLLTVEGAAVRRGGTRYVAEVKNSANRTWLLRFQFNTSQKFLLEIGDQYMRFYTNRGQLLAGSVTAWSNATNYGVGDLASRLGVNYYCKVAHTNQQPPNATYWYPLTGSVYEIPTPWTAADITGSDGTLQLRYVQTGDVIYFVHANYGVRKLTRYSNTKWVLDTATFIGGPFQDQNTDKSIQVYASANTGSVTLTASSSIFTSSMVGSLFYLEVEDYSDIGQWEAGKTIARAGVNPYGRLIRSDGKTYSCAENSAPGSGNCYNTGPNKPIHIYGTEIDGDGQPAEPTSSPQVIKQGIGWTFQDPGYGYLRITAYTSGTQVTATVVSDWNLPANVVGSGKKTFRWAKAAFSDAEGYPTDVTFFRERLTFCKGLTLYMSNAGDFERFEAKTYGQQLADNAIIITCQSDQANSIQWLSAGRKLLIGTAGGELVCGETANAEPLSPANIKVDPQTVHGSAHVPPARIGGGTVFVQRSGRKLREIQYSFDVDSYTTSDLTVLANHITHPGIVDMVYQQEPYTLLWATTSEGGLRSFTYNKEQEVLGWARQPIAGSFGTGDAVVESIQTILSTDGSRDDLWLIVKRTINGSTKRYVEYMTEEYEQEDDEVEDMLYLDCGATYDGSPATTISGLSYLEGQTVSVLADGAVHPDRTVSGGSITLQRAASVVQVGLRYRSLIKTNRIEAGATIGTAQGKMKRIHRVIIRFLNTLGGKAGPTDTQLDTILFRRASDPMDAAPPIQSGDFAISWPNGYDTEGYITVVQDDPLPMTVVSLMPELATNERV